MTLKKLSYFVASKTILKKIAAILLIAVFIFNVIGYNWIFSYMESRATARLEKKISTGQYNDDQLLEIKIPIKVPYYTSTKYETYYGETQFNGEHYRYVKRKISGDTLYLLCLPHTEKDNIVEAKKDFINSANDIQNNNIPQKQEHQSLLKLFQNDYLQQGKINVVAFEASRSQNLRSFDSFLISQFEPQAVAQPPELV